MTTIPGTEHMSPQQQEAIRLLFSMPPDRMAVALGSIKRYVELKQGGMPTKEALRVMWQEAIDAGWIDIDAAPPEVREFLVAAE